MKLACFSTFAFSIHSTMKRQERSTFKLQCRVFFGVPSRFRLQERRTKFGFHALVPAIVQLGKTWDLQARHRHWNPNHTCNLTGAIAITFWRANPQTGCV